MGAVPYMVFNFISSVGIVFMNKVVFQDLGYHYATLVTALHFVATWFGLQVNREMGMYHVKPLKHAEVLPITLSFCSFVVCNNLSLQYNSVGFYQLMKVMTTPVVVVLQDLLYGIHLSGKLKLCLVPVCVGVAMATVNDFSVNMEGFMWATAGLTATAFYQLLVKTKQDQLKASSFQLLHYQAPQSALVVGLCTPLFDKTVGNGGFLEYPYTVPAVLALLTSCFLAYCVNLSTYLVIGHTSPISYHVLGHFKLLVILTAGIVFLGEDSNPWRLLGMALAFAGIVAYTTIKQKTADEWASRSKQHSSLGKAASGGMDTVIVEMSDAGEQDPLMQNQ